MPDLLGKNWMEQEGEVVDNNYYNLLDSPFESLVKNNEDSSGTQLEKPIIDSISTNFNSHALPKPVYHKQTKTSYILDLEKSEKLNMSPETAKKATTNLPTNGFKTKDSENKETRVNSNKSKTVSSTITPQWEIPVSPAVQTMQDALVLEPQTHSNTVTSGMSESYKTGNSSSPETESSSLFTSTQPVLNTSVEYDTFWESNISNSNSSSGNYSSSANMSHKVPLVSSLFQAVLQEFLASLISETAVRARNSGTRDKMTKISPGREVALTSKMEDTSGTSSVVKDSLKTQHGAVNNSVDHEIFTNTLGLVFIASFIAIGFLYSGGERSHRATNYFHHSEPVYYPSGGFPFLHGFRPTVLTNINKLPVVHSERKSGEGNRRKVPFRREMISSNGWYPRHS